MAIVKVEGLTKRYKELKALDSVSFEFKSGILSFLGPSGCGKTTLLRCIAGLEVPDEGSIYLEDKIQTSISEGIMIPPYAREIGFVFQSYALWPHMSVYANVAFGLKLRKFPEAEVSRRVLSTLDLVGLQNLEKRFPYQNLREEGLRIHRYGSPVFSLACAFVRDCVFIHWNASLQNTMGSRAGTVRGLFPLLT